MGGGSCPALIADPGAFLIAKKAVVALKDMQATWRALPTEQAWQSGQAVECCGQHAEFPPGGHHYGEQKRPKDHEGMMNPNSGYHVCSDLAPNVAPVLMRTNCLTTMGVFLTLWCL